MIVVVEGGGGGVAVVEAAVAATFVVVVFNAQEVTLIHYEVNFSAQDTLGMDSLTDCINELLNFNFLCSNGSGMDLYL